MRGKEEAHRPEKIIIRAGHALIFPTVLFMLFDGAMKIVKPPQVLDAMVRLAYPSSTLSGIGIALIACTFIYLIPRTSILGALLPDRLSRRGCRKQRSSRFRLV